MAIYQTEKARTSWISLSTIANWSKYDKTCQNDESVFSDLDLLRQNGWFESVAIQENVNDEIRHFSNQISPKLCV